MGRTTIISSSAAIRHIITRAHKKPKTKGSFSIVISVKAIYAPNIINSGWAKLKISVDLNMRTNPKAIQA
jgi:hypothetical protein